MSHRRVAAALAVLAGGLAASSGALADAPQTITPGPRQTTAIVQAWAAPSTYRGPLRCLTVRISKNQRWLAGVTFNQRASGCTDQAFDGAAVLYGRGNAWFPLAAGSSLPAAQCSSLQLLMRPNGWQDLVVFASRMGCQNID